MGRRHTTVALLLLLLSLLAGFSTHAGSGAADAGEPFPELEGLRPDVEFWVRVFAEWRQGQVVVHDQRHPAIVYEVLDLPAPVGERYTDAQRDWLAAVRDGWTDYLEQLERKIAEGEPLREIDKQWALYFATVVGADKIEGAGRRVRTQRGMRERFREGLARSPRFDGAIREIMRGHGLPEELAYLPHVESSFQYRALSSAGAAGIWQFTRDTGRHYLTINSAMDERLDPLAATDAAARYLREAHQKLGTWPLALTSYNHGVQGMQRAKERFGTDFERIVREYDGRTFGFASRNFYAEFLAARRVARDPARYFPEGFSPEPEFDLDRVVLEERVTPQWLSNRYDVPLDGLAALNLAWSKRAVADALRLPVGSTVWLPRGTLDEIARGGATVAPAVLSGSGAPPRYVVRSGDTLGRIAARHGVALPDLLVANTLSASSVIRPGQVLHIPH